ncbi:putative membrane protein YczE [Dielma fastidiosa]|uniref:Putative membrane protein YczE n=3 Tax=Dielma fastidiosa TaxID=1034346 RepID=A0A318KZ32_9FIRM|nr:putative membrane protein YczE [Dielma fastidiosa]
MRMNTISLKRIGIYFLGLVILCLGVVLNTKTNLGVAAINGIPYVLANTTSISLGTAVLMMYCLFIAVQWLVKKRIDLLTLLQLPISYLFGRMVDVINLYVLQFEAGSFIEGIVMLAAAIILVALGTTLVVSMNLVPNAPDGLVQTIAGRWNQSFGKVKLIFDGCCLCIAAIISWLMLGNIIGLGFGTVCSMALTGPLCSWLKTRFSQWKVLSYSENAV